MVRAAILDDYQNVALQFADWSAISKDVEIKVFNKPFASQDEAIKALQGFAIVVGMRERTPFPHKVIEALPDLKLLITTGARNNSFDVEARRRAASPSAAPALRQPDHGDRLRPDPRADAAHRLRKRPDESRRALAGHARP